MKTRIRQNFPEILMPILLGLLSFAVIALPLIYDGATLPTGWELPKVRAIQLLSLVIIVFVGLLLFAQKKFKIRELLIGFACFGVLSIGAFSSSFTRDMFWSDANPLYKLFGLVEPVKVALWGNQFREQGLVTWVLLLLLILVLSKAISNKGKNWLKLALVYSAVVQAVLGLFQAFDQLLYRPDLLRQGNWVFGTFGQPNFFAGHLLIGIVLSMGMFKAKSGRLNGIIVLALVLQIMALVISQSYWNVLLVLLAAVINLLYSLLEFKKFKRYILRSFLVGIIALPILGAAFLKLFPEYLHRINIWVSILNIYLPHSLSPMELSRFFFGSGPDTLALMLKDAPLLRGSLVDRAHNLILDIFSSFGLSGLTIFVVWAGNKLRYAVQQMEKREIFFIVLAITMWLLRSMIHTSSIINFFDFVILLTILPQLPAAKTAQQQK